MILLLLAQLWTSTPSADPDVLLAGSWQSCRDEQGDYGERVYEHTHFEKEKPPSYRYTGKFLPSYKTVVDWQLHMGPRDEFALYRGDHGPEGEDHRHDGGDNLLAPAYHINDVATWRGKRNWNVPTLHLWISIAAAGGSRDECDSFFVLVKRQ